MFRYGQVLPGLPGTSFVSLHIALGKTCVTKPGPCDSPFSHDTIWTQHRRQLDLTLTLFWGSICYQHKWQCHLWVHNTGWHSGGCPSSLWSYLWGERQMMKKLQGRDQILLWWTHHRNGLSLHDHTLPYLHTFQYVQSRWLYQTARSESDGHWNSRYIDYQWELTATNLDDPSTRQMVLDGNMCI